jgi:phosphatidylglycerol:prolipoprotein diacylglycerol transferase
VSDTLHPMLTLASWLHTLDPFIVKFTENFGLRWYGTAYLAGFAVAWLLLRRLSSTPERPGFTPLPRHRVGDALMWLIGGVLVGGRLGYVLIYDPSLLWRFDSSPPWWGVLAINQGGMASHGGMVGVIIAAWRISRGWRTPEGTVEGRMPALHMMDLVAMLAPAGLLFGRIANFINGELLGKIVAPPGAPGPWWAVQFPQELNGWVGPYQRSTLSHTPPLSEEQMARLDALVTSVQQQRGGTWAQALDWIIDHAAAYADQLRPLLSSRHPSQLYQAVAEGIVVGLVVWAAAARPRKPGVVGCWFLITYGVLRVVTEFWRLPDPQFGDAARIMGLSRGQWLSVGMVVIGAACLAWVTRRAVPRMGGWLRRAEP